MRSNAKARPQKRRITWGTAISAIAAVVVLAAVGCSSGGSGTTASSSNTGSAGATGKLAPAGTATLTVVPPLGAADTWYPIDATSGFMFLGVYSTLLAVQPGGKLTGSLASSWTATPSKITFTIKQGVTCSDGTSLTTADVAASLKYYFASNDQEKISSFGPGPYNVAFDTAAHTVTVTFGTPYEDAIHGFTDIFPGDRTAIICPAGLAALKTNPNALNTPTTTYGSGPYTVSQWVAGGNVTLKLRSDFTWGPDGITAKTPGVPGTVKYEVEADTTTAANLVDSGAANLALVTGPDVQRLQGNSALSSVALTANNVNPMFVNQSSGHPGADVKVRQALITAIDPKLYLEALEEPGALSTSIVPSSLECYDPQTAQLAPTPSVSKATSILESDGWTMQGGKLYKNGQPLTIQMPVESGFGAAAEYLANAFQTMGATVHLQQLDVGTWISEFVSGKYDVTVLNNVLDPPTTALAAATAGYSASPPPSGTNFSYISQWQTYQQYVAQAEATSGTAACAPLDKLQAALWQNWNLLPLYAPKSYFFGNGVDLSDFANRNINPILIKMTS